MTKYVREQWPSGIRITISPQFLASNVMTSIEPRHHWKYELQLELMDGAADYYKIMERNFKWTTAKNEDVRSKGPGLLIQDHNRAYR